MGDVRAGGQGELRSDSAAETRGMDGQGRSSAPARPRAVSNRSLRVCVGGILLAHTTMLGFLSARWSPNIDELAYMAGGLAIWQYGRFDIYAVHPPLVRAVAALPGFVLGVEEDWGDLGSKQLRSEFLLGPQWVDAHSDRWWYLLSARWSLLPLALLGGLCCFAWGSELFGRKAGLVALVLGAVCPNLLSWSAVICTDSVAASLGVAAGYGFWRWTRRPTWVRALVAGLLLGLAESAKMTWIVLFGLWPVLWLLRVVCVRPNGSWTSPLAQLAGILFLGLYVLNLLYCFDGTLFALGRPQFQSRLLAGQQSVLAGGTGGNRFAGTVFGLLLVPLPLEYVRGLDLQRLDFERGLPSYLLGE